MKRLTAILFLSILLFNLAGYRLVIHYLHTKNTAQLASLLEMNNYDDEELISIKTPLSLPYYTNSETYERVDGVISVNGMYYNYVKRRVFNDSLELLCLPNPTKVRLDKAAVDFSKSAIDGAAPEKNSKKLNVINNTLSEFYVSDLINTGIPGITPIVVSATSFVYYLPDVCLAVHTPPPNGHA